MGAETMILNMTGGWVGDGLGLNSTYNYPTNPTVTKSANSITASMGSGSIGGGIHTTNKVDISNYSALKFSGSVSISSGAQCRLQVRSAMDGYISSNFLAEVQLANNATSGSLDISSITGEVYIALELYQSSTVVLNKMWLE